MADLTPDEVMAKHHETVSNIFCADCNDYYPCDAYQQAQARKTAEDYFHSTLDLLEAEQARVTALEAVVMDVADLEGPRCDVCYMELGHTSNCVVRRAVELMEGK